MIMIISFSSTDFGIVFVHVKTLFFTSSSSECTKQELSTLSEVRPVTLQPAFGKIKSMKEISFGCVFSFLPVSRLQTGEVNGFGLKPICDQEAGKHTNGHLPQVRIVCILKPPICS